MHIALENHAFTAVKSSDILNPLKSLLLHCFFPTSAYTELFLFESKSNKNTNVFNNAPKWP